MPKIIVNICTYQRPKMLQVCADSVLRQVIPDNWSLEVHVIDNDPQGIKPEFVAYANTVRYISEPKRGIPFARNAAIKHSLLHHADWIGFIDDDETAEPGWLAAYIEAIEQYDAEVFTGPVKYIFPGEHADWLSNKNEDNTADGSFKSRASTNNVMISTSVVDTDQHALRFDEKMAMMGGSDSDFFMRFVALGGHIIFVKNALVSEVVIVGRTTIRWRLKRQLRSSANRIYIYQKLYGRKKTAQIALKEIMRHLVEGLLGLVLSPFFLVKGFVVFKKRYYHAARHFAKLAGNAIGLAGIHPQPYKNVDGY